MAKFTGPVARALLLGVLLLCVTAAWAQDDEIIEMYPSIWSRMELVISTIMWSSIYLPIYAAALVIPLAYLQRFGGFDAEMLLWIGLLWLGGMVANAIGYAITAHHFLAALIALPLIFGWTVLLSTRSWTDLCLRDAVRVGLVVALVCAPYFGPTWHTARDRKPRERVSAPAHRTPDLLSDRITCVILPAWLTMPHD